MTDVMETDFNEIELRVLASMRQDAENMDETGEFKRPTDIQGIDTVKLKTLMSLNEAEAILKGEGVVKSVDFHKIKAMELYACSEEAVTDEMRTFAKCYNFCELYSHPFPSTQARIDRDLEERRKTVG